MRLLNESDVAEAVDVLCEAFVDYPVMRFVLGSRTLDYEDALRELIRFFVMARVLRGEYLLGVGDQALEAVAILSRPAGPPSPPELAGLRERVWARLGPTARARYDAFSLACAPFQPETPHLHLNMIGVRPRAQGKGFGGDLLESVHELSRTDPQSEGVTLTTEDAANIPLYERFGYSVVGHATISPELESWWFFRPDQPYRRPERRGAVSVTPET